MRRRKSAPANTNPKSDNFIRGYQISLYFTHMCFSMSSDCIIIDRARFLEFHVSVCLIDWARFLVFSPVSISRHAGCLALCLCIPIDRARFLAFLHMFLNRALILIFYAWFYRSGSIPCALLIFVDFSSPRATLFPIVVCHLSRSTRQRPFLRLQGVWLRGLERETALEREPYEPRISGLSSST